MRAGAEAARQAIQAVQARRDAELVELSVGYDAVGRLGRLEGTVLDLTVLTKPYRGIKSIERDERGRITTGREGRMSVNAQAVVPA